MEHEYKDENLLYLVFFELEKYCSNVSNHPLVSDDCHYEELKTVNAHLHRAVHWYLLDNKLVYQAKKLRPDSNKNEYALMWVLSSFDKKKACQEILTLYKDYIINSKYDGNICHKINYSLEKILREKGKNDELNIIFDSLSKKYESNAEIIITEYNKVLLSLYAELIFNK